MKERKFEFGQVVFTRAVAERAEADEGFERFVDESFLRHICGDWGDLDPEDAAMNDEALKTGEARLFSCYIFNKKRGEKIWIITEWDRSTTTVLFPSDY